MPQVHIQYHKTKIGELILGSFENQLCLLDYRYRKTRTTVDNRIQQGLHAAYVEQSNTFLKEVQKQIEQYLSGKRKQWDFPLLMVGTNFQKSVWKALQNIPYGITFSYLQLAQAIHNEKAVRAVASANGANAMSLIIPCHRIIGSGGELVGYAGGIPAKKQLLELEQSDFRLNKNKQLKLEL